MNTVNRNNKVGIGRYSAEWWKLRKNRYNDDYFLRHGIEYIDYKNVDILRQFINPQGRIISAVFNKLTARNQRLVRKAIIRGQYMAFLCKTITNQ